jgi:hypothetical protein
MKRRVLAVQQHVCHGDKPRKGHMPDRADGSCRCGMNSGCGLNKVEMATLACHTLQRITSAFFGVEQLLSASCIASSGCCVYVRAQIFVFGLPPSSAWR